MATIIVGASQGLGEALCESLYQKGCCVVAASRNLDRLEELKRRVLVDNQQKRFDIYPCDVTKVETLKNLMEFSVHRYGSITTLLFVTGVNFDDVIADWTSTDAFKNVIEINLIGAANVLHTALPYLSASPNAHVTAITSLAGLIGCVPGGSGYAASKAGMDSFFASVSPELKALGIKVLIVDPGSMYSKTSERQVIGTAKRYSDARQTRRGKPVEEVADLITDAVIQGKSGRLYSTYRVIILGSYFLKLFIPSVFERLSLRIRFKNLTLPRRLKHDRKDDFE